NFDSTTDLESETRTHVELEDLIGPIGKVVAENGSITLNGGDDTMGLSSSDDVLLEARGAGSDVVINAEVMSTGGHITLVAADDVVVNIDAAVTISGTGTMLILAETGDVTIDGEVTAG